MRVERFGGVVLSLFRVVTGLLFACHGAASVFGVLGGAHGGGTVEFGSWPRFWAAVIQLVCGGLVLIGLGTRVGATVASGSMAYAYFVHHQAEGLWPIVNGGESAAMFCWMFLLVAVLGPGPYALDTLLHRGRRRTDPPAAAPPDTGRGPVVR